MNSNSSVGSTKYDPDLIKADVILARKRVDRLRHELEQIRAEMQYKQRGLDTLAMYIYIQGPVVQNFVSLTSLLRPQLISKCRLHKQIHCYFLLIKCEHILSTKITLTVYLKYSCLKFEQIVN